MLARYTKRETLCFLLKLSTSEMGERKTLLLIHNFLNYLIDKFTPPAHERGISPFSVPWSIVGFYSSANRNEPLDVTIMKKYIGKVENP